MSTPPDYNPDEIESLIRDTARKHDFDEDLAVEVARQESRFKPKATGIPTKYGRAKGLFQFIDDTAKQYGVTDPYDPVQSADAGVRYLKDLHKQYGGDTNKMLAAYNWGPGNLQKHGMEKAPTETRDYITDINANLELNKLYRQAQGGATQPVNPAPKPTITAKPVSYQQPVAQPKASQLSPEDELDQLYQKAVKAQPQAAPTQQPLKVGQVGARAGTPNSQPQNPRALDTAAFALRDGQGKPFGFSKPEVDAYTQAYGVHPAQDPSVQARAANFLNARRVNDVIPGQRAGLLESGLVPATGTGQKSVGEFGGSAVNRFTLGNATLPGYDPVAPVENQSGSTFNELVNPRSVGGVVGDVGNLLGVSGVLKGVGATVEALGQGSKYANAASRLLGGSPAASRIESGLHTGALFGAQAGLSNPDPAGKMSLAQNVTARIENAIKSGAIGSVSGLLAGVDPSLLRETLSFIAPGTTKSVITGYLEGKKPEEILAEVSQEQLPNAIFPIAYRGIDAAANAIRPRSESRQLINPDTVASTASIQPRQPAQINQRVAAEPKPFQPLRGTDVQPVVNGERVPKTLIDPNAPQPPAPPKFEPMIKPRQPLGDQITEKIPVQPAERMPVSTDQAATNTVEPKYFLNPAEWEDVAPKINQQLDNTALGQMIDTLQASGLNAMQIKEYLAKHPESQQAIIDSVPDPEFVARIKNASVYPEASALMDQINQEMAARGYDPQDIGDTDIKRELPELHAQVQAAMQPYREKYQQMLAQREQELRQPPQVVPPARLSSRSATAKILPVAAKGETNARPAEPITPRTPPSGLVGGIDPSPLKEQSASPAEPVIVNKRTDTARVPRQPVGQQPVAPDRPPQELRPALVEPSATTSKPLPEGVTRQGKAFVAPDGKQFTGPRAKDNAEFYTKQKALVGAKVKNYFGDTDIVEKVDFLDDKSRIPTYTVREEKSGRIRQHSTLISDKQIIQRPGRELVNPEAPSEPKSESDTLYQSPQAKRVDAKLSSDALPEKLRATPGQRYSTEGTENIKPSAAHVVGPNRERVAKQFAESFKRPQEEIDAVMTVGDAIATAWAKREGKSADEFYARLSVEKGSHQNATFKGETDLSTFAKDGKAVVRALNNPNISTALHELSHVARRYVSGEDQAVLDNWVKVIHRDRAFDSKGNWTRQSEESFARGFERYLLEGKAPAGKLARTFENIKSWLSDIYGTLESIIGKRGNPLNVNLSDDVRGVYDRLLGGKGSEGRTAGLSESSSDVGRTTTTGDNVQPAIQPVAASVSTPPARSGVKAVDNGTPDVIDNTSAVSQSGISTDRTKLGGSQPAVSSSTKTLSTAQVKEPGTKVRAVYESAKPYLSEPLEKSLKPEEYSVLTNKEAFAQAREKIANDPKGSLASALSIESTKQGGAVQNAISMEMIREAQQKGDVAQARYLIDAMAQRATDAGQAIQILSNISRISPEGVVPYANGVLKRSAAKLDTSKRADSVSKQIIDALNKGEAPEEVINKLFQRATGAKKDQAQRLIEAVKAAKTPEETILKVKEHVNKRFKIPQVDDALAKELYDMASKAQSLTGKPRERALALMMKKIGDQLPPTLASKANFIMRAIDLLNPSGALLNTVGDIVYGSPLGLESISNQVAAGVDYIGTKAGLLKQREFGRPEIRQSINEYPEAIKNAASDIWQGIDTTQTIEGTRGVSPNIPFKGWLPQQIDRAIRLGYGLSQNANAQVAYADSIRSQMKAARLNGKPLTEPTNDMILVAAADANVRALNDKNFVSVGLKKLQEAANYISTGGRSTKIGLGSIELVSYAQAPGSVVHKSFAFSPLGVVTDVLPNLVRYKKALATGIEQDTAIAQRNLVQSIGRTITGGAVLGLGLFLSRMGVLVKQSDEKGEEKLGRLQSGTGINGYRLNLEGSLRLAASGFQDKEAAKLRPGDTLLNYEFAQPYGFLLNFAKNLDDNVGKAIAAGKTGDLDSLKGTGWEVVKNLGTATGETMNDVQVIKSLMDTAKQGGKDGFAERLLENLALRPTPALMRQLRNYADNTQRMTETFGDKVKANIPYKSRELPPARTAFGDEKERMTGGSGAVRSFVLGGRTSTYKTDAETEYTSDLFKARDDKDRGSHIPTPPKEYTDAQGDKHKLTARQKSDSQEFIGKNARELYKTAMSSKEFNNAPANVRGKILEEGLGPIRERAKIDILKQPATESSPKAGQIVPRDPAIFNHNASVAKAHAAAQDSVRKDPALKAAFDGLTPERKKYALDRINDLFEKAKVNELNLPSYLTKEAALQRGQWALRGGFSNNAIKMILENAKYYTKPKR